MECYAYIDPSTWKVAAEMGEGVLGGEGAAQGETGSHVA